MYRAFIPVYVRGIGNMYPTRREFRAAVVAACLDAVGMVCSVLGMKYAGSGLMSVIYASLPACTAGVWLLVAVLLFFCVCLALIRCGGSITVRLDGQDDQQVSTGLHAGRDDGVVHCATVGGA